MRTIAIASALVGLGGLVSAHATSYAPVMAPTGPSLVKPFQWLEDETGASAGLNADGSVREEFVARLIAPLLADPHTAPLVAKALKLSGKDSLSGILKVCTWTWGPENWTQGQTSSSWVTQTALPRAPDMASDRKAERKAYYKKSIQDFVAKYPNSSYFVRANQVGYAVLIASMSSSICIAPNISLRDAQAVLVHELVHFTYPGGSNRIEIQAVRDAEEYALFRFTAPGGEADAFRAGYGASARWAGTTKVIPAELRTLFDADGKYLGRSSPLLSAKGKLIGRREDPVFSAYVLETLGYGAYFRNGYTSILDFFRTLYVGLIDRVARQREWPGLNEDVQARIVEQLAELQAVVAEIDVTRTIPAEPKP